MCGRSWQGWWWESHLHLNRQQHPEVPAERREDRWGRRARWFWLVSWRGVGKAALLRFLRGGNLATQSGSGSSSSSVSPDGLNQTLQFTKIPWRSLSTFRFEKSWSRAQGREHLTALEKGVAAAKEVRTTSAPGTAMCCLSMHLQFLTHLRGLLSQRSSWIHRNFKMEKKKSNL